mgnify:CR=1 FL=1
MMNLLFNLERKRYQLFLTALLWCSTSIHLLAQNNDFAVMEVVEVKFNSQERYSNPYLDVDVWIELKKSRNGSAVYRIPVFWDGGNVFRARLVATSAGQWTWKVINETVDKSDQGFLGKSGSFTAIPADVSKNPNNRGFIRVDPNTNRTLEYADGTPYFYTADTSWSALTAVFDYDRANTISGISFQDYILARKRQGFNGLNVIASFPDDTYLEQSGRNLDRPGTRTGLWASETWGEKVAENGATPFEMKSRGQRLTDKLPEVDYTRIDPEYWQDVDKRMQFLSDQGFVTLFESVRRHERWPFRQQAERDAFYNYIRYLWARYGCYNMIFSWVHHDTNSGNVYPKWRDLVKHANNELYKKIGDYRMPYGQPRTAMSYNSTLRNWERDIPTALDVQNVSNAERDEDMHRWLRDIYHSKTVKPALNLEPFYPGWGLHSGNEINSGLDDAMMAQMQMYGSVLSGGLAGHAWGDAWYAGAASSTRRNQGDGGTIVPKNDPQKNALARFESQAMGHLRDFILDPDHEYERLIPVADTHLSDSQNFLHTLSISDDKAFALGFFTGTMARNPDRLPRLKNLIPSETYRFEWWDVTNGGWISGGDISSTDNGQLTPPALPNKNDRTKNWAYRIRANVKVENDDIVEEEDTVEEEDNVEEEDGTESEPTFALRINAGGANTTHDGNAFIADANFNTGRTLNRPQTGLEDPYKTFRYSRSQVMGYNIPLENGEYTVRLHFAELWFGATGGGSGGKGSRVFDVRLEGRLAEDNLDIFAAVGAETLLVKEHLVTVSDAELNIDFSSLASDGGVRHPVVNAIEILGKVSTPIVPTAVSVAPSSLSLEIGEKDELTATILPQDTTDQGLRWKSSDTSVVTVDQKGQVTAVSEGTATITVTTNDGEVQDTSTVKVTSPPKTSFALRINSGGGKITHNGNTFAADTRFDTGSTLNRPQTGLEDPYKTFRYSTSKVMGYDISLENGDYTVRLHFAELWFGATGGGSAGKGRRVFDVRLEGQLAEDNLDVFAAVGAETLLVREHLVNVTDGQLNIDFSSRTSDGGVRHPIINAIEILSATSASKTSVSLAEKTNGPKQGEVIENGPQPASALTEENVQVVYAHPNPTKDKFKITGLLEGPKQLVVADFSGRILLTLKTDQITPDLDLSGHPDGMYVVKIIQNGVVRNFKVVKE